LAKPNFQFEKRQKELAKKRKSEEKLKRKLDKTTGTTPEDPATEQAEPDPKAPGEV